MNKSQRIYFDTGNTGSDIYMKVRLEQDVDTIEFMSMQLSTEDVYQDFNSDYGVLVGRVTANGGVGIPNAKISIFIPLTDEDAAMGQITSIYPYVTPRDKNNEGKRYNLLPRVSKIDSKTGQWSPKQAFGSFPIKEEVVTNALIMDVYKKYYKYTALTNNAGDYMIFGVPTGTQTVHMSVDITDIGEYSMNPASMVVNLGYSPNLFTNNNTMIKASQDLGDLPNIETQEITVDVIPFWGDTTNFEIGITRQDFRIRATLVNTFTIFGSVFTDGVDRMWGGESHNFRAINELYHGNDPAEATVSISTKRIGKVTETIYYYPTSISDYEIDNNLVATDGSDMLVLDASEYTVHKRDGDFVFIINCNRNRITTDENGNKKYISDDSTEGVFSGFRGFVTLEITLNDMPITASGDIGDNTSLTPYRVRFKFPQHAERDHSFDEPNYDATANADTIAWRKEHHKFEAGKFYSFSRFHGLTENTHYPDDEQNTIDGFFDKDQINHIPTSNQFSNVGVIFSSNINDIEYPNENYMFPYNSVVGVDKIFGANWLNLSIHLPQLAYVDNGYAFIGYVRTADYFSRQRRADDEGSGANNNWFLKDNFQPIASFVSGTKWFGRSDLHWTDIIEVPVTDIKLIADKPKGFVEPTTSTLIGKYRNGVYIPDGQWITACPLNGGKVNGDINGAPDTNTYFYKGFGSADCIQYLYELGLIN